MQQLTYMNNPQDVYRKQGVMTASPLELIIMLYDGCRKKLMMAQRAIAKRDVATAHNHLMRCQDIVGELINSLDLSLDISKDLLKLYEYMLHELAEINHTKDASAIDPLLEMLTQLRDTWQQVNEAQRGTLALVD